MKKVNLKEYIENNLIDYDVSYRGGYIKVDLSNLFSNRSIERIEEAGETAIAGSSQNYLGGGVAGGIRSGSNFDTSLLTKEDLKKYRQFSEEIKKYHYKMNNGGGDDYMQENASYQKTQSLPYSAY